MFLGRIGRRQALLVGALPNDNTSLYKEVTKIEVNRSWEIWNQLGNRGLRFRYHMKGRVWDSRQHFEWSGKVDLVHAGKNQSTDGQVVALA
jgi:hypothetical protein